MTTAEIKASAPQEGALARFVDEVRAARQAARDLDWTPPPPPPEPPPFIPPRLKWDRSGLVNQAGGQPLSVDDLRTDMGRRMRSFLADPAPGVLLVKVAAGGGKTTAGVQTAQWAAKQGWRVLWAGMRHDMFEDLRLIPGFEAQWWYHWQPIRLDPAAPDDPEKTTCRYGDAQKVWLSKGYSAMGLCEQLCRFDGHIKQCAYRAQAKRKERIIYGMHQHLASGLAIQHYRAAFIDELPLGAFVDERLVSFDDLNLKAIGPLGDLLMTMRAEIAKLKRSQQLRGKALWDTIGETMTDVYAQVEITPDAIPQPPAIYRPEEVGRAPSWFIKDVLLASTLEHEAWDQGWDGWAERVWLSAKGLHILRRAEPWQHLPRKLIALDATANADLYRQMLPDREVIEYAPELKRAGQLYQVVGRLNGKGTLVSKRGKVSRQASEALAVAQQIAAPYRRRDERVAVIVPKDLRPLFEREFGVENVEHFYGLRGTNALESAACLIVVGAPAPDLRTVVNTATALNATRQASYADIDERGRYRALMTSTEREYRVTPALMTERDGLTPRRAISGFWAAPELQAVYEQLREAELAQALHRSRVNVRDTTVWLLTSVPTGEALDGVWDDPPPQAGFPADIPWTQWLKLKPWLDGREEVSIEDLATAAGVSADHVKKERWLDGIAQFCRDEWQVSAIKRPGPGRPKKCLARAG